MPRKLFIIIRYKKAMHLNTKKLKTKNDEIEKNDIFFKKVKKKRKKTIRFDKKMSWFQRTIRLTKLFTVG